MEFSFGEQVLDVDRRELRRRGELIELEPQVFDLLVYLVRNRERVVSKDDLLQSVWGGRIVSESTLISRINAVRKAVGDDGQTQRLIRTMARKGFRFVGDVREERPTDPRRLTLALPDKPSIAVLPFVNMSRLSSRSSSLMASRRMSSQLSRIIPRCSSSPAIQASPTRPAPST
jgi:DNA-binding winged helix-turn-helix (wHTH) protein